jgi:hypothetical protein
MAASTACAVEEVDIEEASIVNTSRSEIPEARELSWTDTYFEESKTEGVIAVFDLDYDMARKTVREAQCCLLAIGVFYVFINRLAETLAGDTGAGETGFMASMYVACFAFIAYKLQKTFSGIQGCHLAITEEGIHKVSNGFPFDSFFHTSNTTVSLTIMFVELNSIDTSTHDIPALL